MRANKYEGDGATPRGQFRLVRLWWRADRHSRPPTHLPVRRITPNLAWCENTSDRRYNRAFRRSAGEPGDRLWRDDRLYDFVIEVDHNTRPRIAGRGSAVFIHVARPDQSPTAGCVALRANELRRLLAAIGPETRIAVRLEMSRHRKSPCRLAPGWRRKRSQRRNPRSCPSTAAASPLRRAILAVSAKCGAGGSSSGRNAHQPGDREPIALAALPQESVGLIAARPRLFAVRHRY